VFLMGYSFCDYSLIGHGGPSYSVQGQRIRSLQCGHSAYAGSEYKSGMGGVFSLLASYPMLLHYSCFGWLPWLRLPNNAMASLDLRSPCELVWEHSQPLFLLSCLAVLLGIGRALTVQDGSDRTGLLGR